MPKFTDTNYDPEFDLTPEEDRQMDFICDAIIDLILSNPDKYLIRSRSRGTSDTIIFVKDVWGFHGKAFRRIITLEA